ncbi:MAG: Crp/Fnr family transcriptional regulator [Microscillaceae bacterium]|jgi:CRP-like cAMP-binding protein|nr:Crp/Fnr family transcriptional regulator [Microscillaceae bacterium]
MSLEKFKTYIRQFVQPSDSQMEDFLRYVHLENYQKGEYLLQTPAVCPKIWFINEGIARHFFNYEQNEGTVWFSFAGDLLTEVYSFTHQVPAIHNIIAVTDLETLSMNYADLQKMYAQDAIWERFGRLSNEEYILKLINRSYTLLFKDGKAKYEDFISRSPEILQNIPLHQIADYIGVSFETLSRIRAKRN